MSKARKNLIICQFALSQMCASFCLKGDQRLVTVNLRLFCRIIPQHYSVLIVYFFTAFINRSSLHSHIALFSVATVELQHITE